MKVIGNALFIYCCMVVGATIVVISLILNSSTRIAVGRIDCSSLCNRYNGSQLCIPMSKSVLIYPPHTPMKQMLFKQTFEPFVPVNSTQMQMKKELKSVVIDKCPIDQYFRPFSSYFYKESCAVVGNGGILFNSSCGKEIDSHSCVIRMNLKPVEKFTSDVGNRTDLMAINKETLDWLFKIFNSGNKYLSEKKEYLQRLISMNNSVLWFPKNLQGKEKNFQKLVEELRKYGLNITMAYNWQSVSFEKEWKLRTFATQGLNVYGMVRYFCKTISLYGFFPFTHTANGRPVPHHYSEKITYDYDKLKMHNFTKEFHILQKLQKDGKIKKMVTDKCPIR